MSPQVVGTERARRAPSVSRELRGNRPIYPRTVVRRAVAGVALAVPVALLLAAAPALAQEVTGTVTSAETAEPLPGISVAVRGETAPVLTDANGAFSLTVPSLEDTLHVAGIGYSPQDVAIAGRTTVNVALQPQAVTLEGLVVVGYGTQERRDITGSVASVDPEEITRTATPSITQALQGKVAGVQVTPASGEPGDSAVVRIRGVGTLNDASPLYVVDGMLLDDIAFLNPRDIETVQVLKDASATAIYGSRGANGVIIITTKQGNLGQATRFSFSAYAGMQSAANPLDLVNARQYAVLANELAANEGLPNPYFDDPQSLGAGTDWQDVIFQAAPIQNYQVSARGGGDKTAYYFGSNFTRQQGIIPKSGFDRLTARMNGDYYLTDALHFGNNISFAYTKNQQAPNVLRALYVADPTIAPTDESGNFNNASVRSGGNPAATIFYTHNGGTGHRLVGNAFGELTFLRDFTLRSSVGVDYQRTGSRNFVPVFSVSPTQQNPTSNLRVEDGTNSSWLWENTLNYTYNAPTYRITGLAGITAQSFYTESLGGTRTNIVGTDPSLWYLNAGDADGQTNFNTASNWKMLSYLFRTNYSYLDRYLLTASLRVDGSSRFGPENRYGWFPSIALGWNLAEESFLRDDPVISSLKLRASWGQIGNDKIGAYPGIPIVTGNLSAVFGPDETLNFGATPIDLANPDVKWERTIQTDVGADLSLYDGRFGATVDYYHRLTDGILVQVPIPRYVGVAQEPFVNAAKVLNSGFEGTLTWTDRFGDLGIDLGVNGSTIHNEVRELGGGKSEILGGGLGNEVTFTTRTAVGHPIGAFWGYKVLGVFQTPEEIASSPTQGKGTGLEEPGDLRFADTNGDGTITEADKTYLGSPIPDFVYGFNARLNWRDFDLSAGFSGQMGNEIFNGKKAVRFGVNNFEESYLDRWTGAGTSNTEPRVTNAGHNYQASTRFIEDGSFLTLNSAQLGYSLPDDVTERLNVGQARIYVGGTNLFTVTDYTGYTPQLTGSSVIASGIDLGVYPVMRVLTAGLDVTF